MSQSFKTDNASTFMATMTAKMGDGTPHGYKKLTEEELNAAYRTSWICRKVCDQYASDMVSQGVEWLIDSDRSSLLERKFRDLGIWRGLIKAIAESRLYGGAIAVLDWGTTLYDQPINLNASGFSGIRVFSRYEVTPDTANLIPAGVHAGEPSKYSVSPVLLAGSFTADSSRCLRFIGCGLPDRLAQAEQLWGDSVLQAMGNVMIHYENANTSIDELVKRCYLRYLGINGYWDAMASEDATAASNIAKGVDMVNRMQNISGLTVSDASDVFSTQQCGFGGVVSVLGEFAQQIAGATEMPLMVIFGMSPAGFSTGESDLKSYERSILSKQEATLREPIATIAKAVLGSEGLPFDDLDFRFKPLFEPSLPEKAGQAASVVDTVMKLVDGGLISVDKALAEIKRLSESTGFFSSIAEEDIERLKLQPPPDEPDAEKAVLSPESV